MATKNQHFVPRVYLKAWETQVETKNEPQKKFNGVYYFEKGNIVGEGAKRETILWKPHLYTISFRQLYLAKRCPKICSFFVDEIFKLMNSNSPHPVYGKLNYSIIKTKKSIRKHLYDIDNWEFYYYDGTIARKKALLNRFDNMHCYLLEYAFSTAFENKWESILNTFIKDVKNASPTIGLGLDRKISEKAAIDMMRFFFMMLCRNPDFDAMGIYSWMSNILKQVFTDNVESKEMMESIWFTELYRMIYKENGGFYHTAFAKTVENCQFILYEIYPNEGSFITSDNPAFRHISHVESDNMNGFFFPISPSYLLFIAKGSNPVNIVSYRSANRDLIKKINRIIAAHSNERIISIEKQLTKIL